MKKQGHISDHMSLLNIAKKHGVKNSELRSELKKGIQVEKEHTSSNTKAARIALDHLFEDPHKKNKKLTGSYGDLSDSSNLSRLIENIKPDEIYNLGAQSHVGVSFENPEYTAQVTGLGSLRVLEAMRFLNLK